MLTGVSGEALHEALRNLKRGYPFIAMLPVLGAGSAVTFVDAPASREGGGTQDAERISQLASSLVMGLRGKDAAWRSRTHAASASAVIVLWRPTSKVTGALP